MSSKIFLIVCLVVLLISFCLIIKFKSNESQQTFPAGTQIEYREKIEVDQGYERHEVHEKRWSLGK
jgi:flagellar basal body-associated protein FliL